MLYYALGRKTLLNRTLLEERTGTLIAFSNIYCEATKNHEADKNF